MSHNLARLRALFGDELLTRSSEGMRPTPRALALVDPVRVVLSRIEALVSRDKSFDPRTAERLFRIGLPDSMEVLLGPALLAYLLRGRARYPSAPAQHRPSRFWTISMPTVSTSPSASVFSRRGKRTISGACSTREPTCACSTPTGSGFPRRSRSRTTCGYRTCSRACARTSAAWWMTPWQKLGLQRTVVLTTPRFLAVPFLVARAPVVVTMPARLARSSRAALGLSASPAPVELPEVPVSLLWHASYDEDPAHVWLRRTIAHVTAEAVREHSPA